MAIQIEHLANFDAAPREQATRNELDDALRAVRAMVLSPSPLLGWRRVVSQYLRLPIRPGRWELAQRDAMLVLIRVLDDRLSALPQSGTTEGT